MATTFKTFRGDEIQITPYDAHKEYLVYIEDFTGSYYEPYYEQSRIFNHPLTSSAPLEEKVVDLDIYVYEAAFEKGDFFPDEFGKYQGQTSHSGHLRTTNNYFKRSIHGSVQGMYYTNPDDPCYTLDNSGYDKEYRELNSTAQVLSVPQRIMGDSINKGTVKIQSGSLGSRITLRDDGFGNLYDIDITGSVDSGSVLAGGYESYVSKSLLTLNFSGLYNQSGNKITANSINSHNLYQQKYGGDKFNIRNDVRFFDRSRWTNRIEMYNATAKLDPISSVGSSEGAYIELDGIEQTTVVDRSNELKNSFIQISATQNLDLRRNEDYTVAMRISCSAVQPTYDDGLHNYNHLFIMHKQDYKSAGAGGYPFSLRQVSNHSPGGDFGTPGHLQAQIKAGSGFVKLNSTGSVTGSGNKWWDIALVKDGDTFSMYIDGHLEDSGTIPSGNIHNKAPITIGCTRQWGGQYQVSSTTGAGNTFQKATMENRANWQGGISNFNIYNTAFTPAEVSYYVATKGRMTNFVGNVFYNHGIVTITSEDFRYRQGITAPSTHDPTPMLGQCTFSMENSHQILEHEYSVHLKEREYMYTMNPTIVDDSKLGTLKHYVTQSSWSPYITTIGLYDEHARLLAIGKLSRAIKKSEDYDTTFIVRFDT